MKNFSVDLVFNAFNEIESIEQDLNLINILRINNDLINYYNTPGNIYNLVRFSEENKYDLSNVNLKELLRVLIEKKHYKKNNYIKFMTLDFIEYYFQKISTNFSSSFFNKYSYYIKRISDTKRFNLDEDSLFTEFENELLNG